MKQINKYSLEITLFLLTLPFLYFAFIYLAKPTLNIYDASAHLNLVWNIKENLWPDFSGLNSSSLLGFDQGKFYPPLFHYLIASISFILGIELAAKLILAFSIIILPISIYYFVKTIFKDRREQILLTSALALLLFLAPGYLGGNLKALFQIGLLPSFFSLFIVFLYLGALRSLNRTNWVLISVLFSLVALTHLVAAIFLGVYFISVFINEYLQKRKLRYHLYHIVSVAFLTVFFWLPFIFDAKYMSVSVHPGSLGPVNLASLLISLLLVIFTWKKQAYSILPLALAVFILSFLTSADFIVNRFFQNTLLFEKVYNLHLYRLQIYEFILSLVLVFYYPVTTLYKTVGRKISRLYLLAFSPLIALSLIALIRPIHLVETENIKIGGEEKIKGRFIETYSRVDSHPFVYTPQVRLSQQEKNTWAYGLFTDASANGPYLSSLVRSFSPESYAQAKTSFIEEKTVPTSLINERLELFAIDNLLFIDPSEKRKDGELNLLLRKFGTKEKAEIIKQDIKIVSSNWNKEVESWWLSKEPMKELLINSSQKEGFNSGEGKLEIINKSENWEKFSLKIDAEDKVPTLVKLAYSPRWKAYQDNQEIKIFQTSPSLMMINAKGEIDFRYQRLWYEYLSLCISAITLLALVYLQIRVMKMK